MRGRRTWWIGAVVVVGILVPACSDATDEVGEVVDDLAERGVAAYAEGRWRCEAEVDDGGDRSHVTTFVDIAGDGRFAFGDGVGSAAGTWEVEGLELRLRIPWMGDGRRGYYPWRYRADADPPTRLVGEQTESGDGQQLELEVSKDQVRIVQHDEPGPTGPNYDWDVTCERESTTPASIPPTVPSSPGS